MLRLNKYRYWPGLSLIFFIFLIAVATSEDLKKTSESVSIDAKGELGESADSLRKEAHSDLVQRLLGASNAPDGEKSHLTEDLAKSMATTIQTALTDPKYADMLERVKQDGIPQHYLNMKPYEIVGYMTEMLVEINALESLIQADGHTAYEMALEHEVFPKELADDFKDDHAKMEKYIREKYFATFIALGVAGGYLENWEVDPTPPKLDLSAFGL
jgi:hypothetical protein